MVEIGKSYGDMLGVHRDEVEEGLRRMVQTRWSAADAVAQCRLRDAAEVEGDCVMVQEWLGWHFLPDDGMTVCHPQHPTQRVKVQVGQTLSVPGPVELCRWGLHASRRALDALQYAPGSIACWVRLQGEIVEGDDKACATERTVLGMVDATHLLHEYACDAAEQLLLHERGAGREPDARSWAVIVAKRAWLRGEISDQELAAARDAVWAAASDVACAAAAAVWAAAKAAAAAVWAAASDVACAAAESAAWAAARAAVWAAASDAAWSAAWDEMNADLERRLLEAMQRK